MRTQKRARTSKVSNGAEESGSNKKRNLENQLFFGFLKMNFYLHIRHPYYIVIAYSNQGERANQKRAISEMGSF